MNTKLPRNGARGSEVPVGDWLETVGATDVRFVGDGEGPPDYLVQFAGKEVAVEVTRMLNANGWPERHRIAFERVLGAIVQMVAKKKEAPKWHVWCEYDPKMRKPPKPNGAWRIVVEKNLRTPGPGGQVQLISDELRVGRGVVLGYTPAGNAGSFAGVQSDMGNRPAGAVLEHIVDMVAIKAQKVRHGARAQSFTNWWLVLDEEIVVVHPILGREWTHIENQVRLCNGVQQWNKIVLYSRYTGSWRTVYERTGELALPVCKPIRA